MPNIPRIRLTEKLGSLAPERFNQEAAFLTMYLKARRTGLDDTQAAEYALLRGNLYSQFLGLKTDQPRALYRTGETGLLSPIRSMAFQFKRFQVKNLEMGFDLASQAIASGKVAGFAKWLGALVAIGGLRTLTHPIVGVAGGAYITLKTYNWIKEEYGERLADLIAYGLPSLLGIDLSYSVQLFDVPRGRNIPEAIGNLLLGPIGSLGIGTLTTVFDPDAEKGLVEDPGQRALREFVRRAPALRWLEGMRQLWEHDYNFTDARGRLRFKGDLRDVLLKMQGFRTLTEAHQDAILSAFMEVRPKWDQALDRAAAILARTRVEGRTPTPEENKAIDLILGQWNALYPEFVMRNQDVTRRAKSREEVGVTPLAERIIEQGPAALRQPFQEMLEPQEAVPAGR